MNAPIDSHLEAIELTKKAQSMAAVGKTNRAAKLYEQACDLHVTSARMLPIGNSWKARCYYDGALKAIMYGNYHRAKTLCKLTVKYGTVETGATSYRAQSLILQIDEFLAAHWAQPDVMSVISGEEINVPEPRQRNELDEWFK